MTSPGPGAGDEFPGSPAALRPPDLDRPEHDRPEHDRPEHDRPDFADFAAPAAGDPGGGAEARVAASSPAPVRGQPSDDELARAEATREAERGDAAIVLTGVVKSYRDVVALSDLSLTVRRGEILGLLGPNGCGKTTTINVLCGLTRPTAGSVRLFDRDVVKHPGSIRPLLGMVSQETALYDELDAWTNLMFHAELYGVPRGQRRDRVQESLELVGLGERARSRVGTFSGGMKRRLAIARALLHHPEVIYLDEPTLGVDVPSRRAIWNHILGLRAAQKTVLLTTNYLEEASELCDRIAIMRGGRIAALDTAHGLRTRFGHSITELGITRPATEAVLARVQAVPGVTSVHPTPQTLQITFAHGMADSAGVINVVARACELTSITERHPTLDEVFTHLTTSEPDHAGPDHAGPDHPGPDHPGSGHA